MELYFNDFDADLETHEPHAHADSHGADVDAAAEELAFAELTERVSAARLVY